ncbi:hypothetical protein CR513_00385, partial [Mucuna pruriens]
MHLIKTLVAFLDFFERNSNSNIKLFADIVMAMIATNIVMGRNTVIKLQKKEMTIEPKEGKRVSLPIRVTLLELKSLKRFRSLLKGC